MRQFATAQRRKGRQLYATGLRRWLAMLLMVAVAASGLLHIAGDDHAVVAAAHLHEQPSATQQAGDENCSPEHRGEPHGTTCSMTGDCSVGMLVAASAGSHSAGPGPSELRPEAVHSGIILFAQFRPPKLFPNV